MTQDTVLYYTSAFTVNKLILALQGFAEQGYGELPVFYNSDQGDDYDDVAPSLLVFVHKQRPNFTGERVMPDRIVIN